MARDLLLPVVLFGLFFLLLFYLYYRAQQKMKRNEERFWYQRTLCEHNLIFCRQENDVWNISGRVHNHEQWPTHDHHISIDSYVFPSESKDPRLAPPAYSEVGLPTYEEAINASNHHKTTTLPAPVHTVVQVPRENS